MSRFIARASAAGESVYQFKGRRKVEVGGHMEYSKRHTLVFNPGDVYSVKITTRGPTAGRYQIVFERAPHVKFRSVPPEAVAAIIKDSKPADVKIERTKGTRAAYTTTRSSRANKQKDDLYKPPGTINERSTYDKNNYQWRLIVGTKINVKTLKQGRVRAVLKDKDIVGVRYVTKSKGGFVLLPDDQRINISHENYLDIIEGSRILAPARQQKGLVVIADIKTGPKDRIITRDETGQVVRNSTKTKSKNPIDMGRGLLRDAKKVGGDELGDWDDSDGDIPKTVADKMRKSKQPAQHRPTQLKVGSTVRAGRSTESIFIVANIEDLGKVNEYALFNVATRKVAIIKLDKNKDMTKEPDFAIMEDATKPQTAAAIRAYNKFEQQQKAKAKPIGRRR